MVTAKKWQALRAWMTSLGLTESAIEEKFIKGHGRGGQKQNKTTNCVVLTHAESGLVIKCQQSRSREDNRYHARKTLCQKLDLLINGEDSQLAQEQKTVSKQKKRRRRRSKNSLRV